MLSAQNKQKVSVLETKEELKKKNSGYALQSKELESSLKEVAKSSIEKELETLEMAPELKDLESSLEKVKKSNLEKDFESLEIVQEFESLVKQAHKQLEDKLLEEMEVAQELKEMVRKDDEDDLVALLGEFEQELKELNVANEMIKTRKNNEAPIEDFVEKGLQKNPAPLSTVTPTKSLTHTPTKLLTPDPNMQPKLLQHKRNCIQGIPTMIPSKKPKNCPTKLPKVTPAKTPIKPPNIELAIKPPKKPPPDSKCNNHAGGQRVRVGAANIKPGQHRSKVRLKDTVPDQRVPGWEKHSKKKKDAALIQRVPGQKQRDQKVPREGVLETLQVYMHPNVGPDTGSRTIMVPLIGY